MTRSMDCPSTPCRFCPYRKDVPSGIWAANHYQLLADFDQPTEHQPTTWFACHAKPHTVCTGWLHTSIMAPPGWESPGLRVLCSLVNLVGMDKFDPTVPLFERGREACEHGMRDIDCPGDEAEDAMEQLQKMIDSRNET